MAKRKLKAKPGMLLRFNGFEKGAGPIRPGMTALVVEVGCLTGDAEPQRVSQMRLAVFELSEEHIWGECWLNETLGGVVPWSVVEQPDETD